MPIRLQTEIPGPKSRELMQRRQQHVARGPFHTTPIFIKSAHGAFLKDVDGNELLDFASGIGVVNVGHTPDSVVEAINNQAKNLLHGSFNVTPYPGYVELCEKLNAATPGQFHKKTFLANSGAEAVENAVKIARAFTKRSGVVCFEHAFHGRTFMAMTLTYKDKPYRAGFGSLNSDVFRAPYPYSYRHTGDAFAQFKTIVEELKEKPACVIIEPVVGEGGFVVAPTEYLAKLQSYCTDHAIVLIADEIQSGFGRTGTMYASEQLGLIPDLILSAKGLGAGMPISAVTGRAEIMDAPTEGGIGGTFGGNPVSCAAALAVFEIFEKLNVAKRAQALGAHLQNRLARMFETYSCIGETRGLGPMRAIELVKDRATKEPNPELAKALVKYGYEHGLVLMTSGSYSNVIRFLMPLTTDLKDVDLGLNIVEEGLKKLTHA